MAKFTTSFAPALALVLGAAAPVLSVPGSLPEPNQRKLTDQSYLCTVTLANLRSVRFALLAWAQDHEGSFPPAKTASELKALLAPAYIGELVTVDAWGTEFRYRVEDGGKAFVIASAGSDRSFDESTWSSPGLLASSKEDATLGVAPQARREWIIQE